MNNIFIITFIHITIHTFPLNCWPNHDISSLKLLQVIHRHGDRSPLEFSPNDPFKHPKYWTTGLGGLTAKGKHRMYRLGQFIRQEYDEYLGQSYSPRDVYARSSITDRCLESIQCLLSGAYPPKSSVWKWSSDTNSTLGQLWQPIPVQTFMPKSEDIVLNRDKRCPVVDKELKRIYGSEKVKQFLKSNQQLYEYLSPRVGHSIDSIKRAQTLHSTLDIEINSGYYWSDIWTRGEEQAIVTKLYPSHALSYQLDWDSHLIRRLRTGGLVKELNNNFLKSIANQKQFTKLYLYSTHDTQITGLMHAYNVFNGQLVPFGATLLLELHERNELKESDKYFVKLFYINDTFRGFGHKIAFTDCEKRFDCPFHQFLDSTKHLIYNDFDKECQQM